LEAVRVLTTISAQKALRAALPVQPLEAS